jgi:hypothetical protein
MNDHRSAPSIPSILRKVSVRAPKNSPLMLHNRSHAPLSEMGESQVVGTRLDVGGEHFGFLPVCICLAFEF